MDCRVSGKPLIEVVDFGKQPLGNGFLTEDLFSKEYFYNMKVGFDEESMMLQLFDQPKPEYMFHEEYAFFSSTSRYMQKHFQEWAEGILNKEILTDKFIVEIGCNDGILLENFSKRGVKCLGVEPSENVAKIASSKGIDVINEFMCSATAENIKNKHGEVDYIFAANVICHIPAIVDFAKSIEILLSKKGVFTFEEPYLGDVIDKCSYDQIYDEHVFVFSCLSIQHLFNKVGLELINAEHQTTHGGSMRYTIGRKNEHKISDNVKEYIDREVVQGLNNAEIMKAFGEKVSDSKEKLNALLSQLKSEGHVICGYAATSKSTTILNYCGIDSNTVDCIFDTTPMKQGKYSPGMHIPILPWEEFSHKNYQHTFLFAWNHINEIMNKESEYTSSGGKWITHVPTVKII